METCAEEGDWNGSIYVNVFYSLRNRKELQSTEKKIRYNSSSLKYRGTSCEEVVM